MSTGGEKLVASSVLIVTALPLTQLPLHPGSCSETTSTSAPSDASVAVGLPVQWLNGIGKWLPIAKRSADQLAPP